MVNKLSASCQTFIASFFFGLLHRLFFCQVVSIFQQTCFLTSNWLNRFSKKGLNLLNVQKKGIVEEWMEHKKASFPFVTQFHRVEQVSMNNSSIVESGKGFGFSCQLIRSTISVYTKEQINVRESWRSSIAGNCIKVKFSRGKLFNGIFRKGKNRFASSGKRLTYLC